MDVLEQPAKRLRMTPDADRQADFDTNADYVALQVRSAESGRTAPTEIQVNANGRSRRALYDPRNRSDRPKAKHALPADGDWVLVTTKLGRRFVHNLRTKQSLWRVPPDVQTAVDAFDLAEEKKMNMAWSEDQYKLMQQQQQEQKSAPDNTTADPGRRRRSISLQREDEEAMMAELAAEAEHAEEQDAREAALAVAGLEPRGYIGEASDSEYEYVEVTDTEGEADSSDDGYDDHESAQVPPEAPDATEADQPGPVDFGEDDIAYQLAMMGEQYGLDPEEYEEQEDGDDEDGMDDVDPREEDAVALFHQMLEDSGVSPFTPWDKLISDESSASIVFDERYTVLRSSRARKDAWDNWSRDRAASIKIQRALEEKRDPRIAYLEFLADHASTKLYWPEFKRKFKREPEMNDRSLQDKDREKYYRELVVKLKLPETKRNEELGALLKSVPSGSQLPDKILTNVVLYTVPSEKRRQALQPFEVH